jgi:hypothetical protein
MNNPNMKKNITGFLLVAALALGVAVGQENPLEEANIPNLVQPPDRSLMIPDLPQSRKGGESVFEDVAPPEAGEIEVDNSTRPIIEFNDAPFANVMRLLSRQAGISFLEPNLSDEPLLTITLRDITPLEAFKTIAEFRGFKVRAKNGIYTLSRPDLAGAEALIVKKYRLSHLDPTWVLQEIANLLGITLTIPAENLNSIPAPQQADIGGAGSGGSSQSSFGGGVPTQPRWLPSLPFDSPASVGGNRAEFAGGATMPSAIWVDRRDNAVVVRASRDEHSMVEEYIKENDYPEPLIVIDCRVIELTDGVDSDIGMDWDSAFGPGGGVKFSLDPSLRTAPSGMFDWASAFEFFFFPFGAVVDWPKAEATFRAWERENKAHAISTPRVVTKSGVPVSIVSVIQEPIETFSAGLGGNGGVNNNIVNSGTETFTYGVTMDVIPRLLANNFVDLNINPIVSQKIGEKQVGSREDGTAQTLPIISKRNATTTVRVQSGQTVIIGGLMSLNDKTISAGVPPFNKIPIVGNLLYGKSVKENKKTNLLIFVTPRVIPADRAPMPTMTEQEQKAYNDSLRLDPPYKSVPVKMDRSLSNPNPPVEMIPRAIPVPTPDKKQKGKVKWPWQKKQQ